MMGKARAMTLVEIAVSVLLGSVVMLAASRMLSSGMKTSTKGAAHLTNVQAVSVLMAQIEEDIQRAVDVSFLTPGSPEPSMKIVILEDRNGKPASATVIYEVVYEKPGDKTQVIKRTHTDNGGSGASEGHPFCRGLQIVGCSFTRLDLQGDKVGFQVDIKVATPPNRSEEFEMQRFILCRNHASNSLALGWQSP